MKASDIPTKFNIPFAFAAGGGFVRPIPEASQIGIQGGAASLTDGFVPVNFLPIGAGGVPPFGQDANGILRQITQWSRWQNAGASVRFDAAFAAAIGGYPEGSVLRATGGAFFWQCTLDDNTNDPDAGGAGWIAMTALGPARVVIAYGAFTILDTDVSIGLARTGTPSNSSSSLPAAPQNGREIWVEDLNSTFQANPVLISATGGKTIAGLPSYTINANRACVRFRYYADASAWSLKV
jgi:hypothetical protein